MTFTEKLKRAAASVNKAKAGESVGLKATTISNYIATGSIPRADIALKIARALDVPVEWLIDDDQGWPVPVRNAPSPSQIPERVLMADVARRYRMLALDLRSMLAELKAMDWASIAKQAHETPFSDSPPPEARRAIQALDRAMPIASLARKWYDARAFAEEHHATMPGNDLPPEEVAIDVVLDEWEKWAKTNQNFIATDLYRQMADFFEVMPDKRDELETRRLENLDAIRNASLRK